MEDSENAKEVKISVIIPTHNDESTIVRTLKSVWIQKYNNWECIIIENNSTDKTYKNIEKYIKDKPNFKLLTHALEGAALARNRGIKEASGEYIVFIDGDDIFLRDNLFSTINTSVGKIRPDLIYWNQKLLVDNKVEDFQWWFSPELKTKPYFKADDKTAPYLFAYQFAPIYPGRFCVSVDFLRKNGIKFDESVMISEDALPRMQMICLADKIVRYDEPFLLYTYSDSLKQVKKFGLVSSLSSKKGAIAQNSVNRNCFEFISDLKKKNKINQKVYTYACREICINLLWGLETVFVNSDIGVWQFYYENMRIFINKNNLLEDAFPDNKNLWPNLDLREFLVIVKDTTTVNSFLIQWMDYFKQGKGFYEHFFHHPVQCAKYKVTNHPRLRKIYRVRHKILKGVRR